MDLTFLYANGYDFDTATYLFVMVDGTREVQCGVSEEAMDDAEQTRNVRATKRGEQFERLKARISECATRKYTAGEMESGATRILVRSKDLTPRNG